MRHPHQDPAQGRPRSHEPRPPASPHEQLWSRAQALLDRGVRPGDDDELLAQVAELEPEQAGRLLAELSRLEEALTALEQAATPSPPATLPSPRRTLRPQLLSAARLAVAASLLALLTLVPLAPRPGRGLQLEVAAPDGPRPGPAAALASQRPSAIHSFELTFTRTAPASPTTPSPRTRLARLTTSRIHATPAR